MRLSRTREVQPEQLQETAKEVPVLCSLCWLLLSSDACHHVAARDWKKKPAVSRPPETKLRLGFLRGGCRWCLRWFELSGLQGNWKSSRGGGALRLEDRDLDQREFRMIGFHAHLDALAGLGLESHREVNDEIEQSAGLRLFDPRLDARHVHTCV